MGLTTRAIRACIMDLAHLGVVAIGMWFFLSYLLITATGDRRPPNGPIATRTVEEGVAYIADVYITPLVVSTFPVELMHGMPNFDVPIIDTPAHKTLMVLVKVSLPLFTVFTLRKFIVCLLIDGLQRHNRTRRRGGEDGLAATHAKVVLLKRLIAAIHSAIGQARRWRPLRSRARCAVLAPTASAAWPGVVRWHLMH